MENVIAAIDVWSSKIKTVIWVFASQEEVNNWIPSFNVLGVWIAESNAIRKWNILDMEEFKNNLESSLIEAEKMSGEQMVWAFLSFNSSSMDVASNKWIVAISGEEIDYSDIDRALDMARNGVDLPNREVLKVIPDTFTVDVEEGIKSPIWMAGRKLEVNTNIFSISKNVLNNIKKAVSDIGLEIYDIYPNIISSPEWVLTKRQKELWAVVIDIWASTTWVTVYEEGTLKHSAVIPLGWESVTNDIALWVRTWVDVAEKLKIEQWDISPSSEENFRDVEINLTDMFPGEAWEVSVKYLSQILTARYREILFFVKEELRRIWKDWMLPEGAVIIWGWAKMKGLTPLVKEVLRLPVTVWLPLEWAGTTESSISDPSFAGVIWTMILAKKYSLSNSSFWMSFNPKWIWDSLVKIIKKILP